ncbi:MAG: helix-turn-helix transcriptional regulator [Kouleothrix sp.]|jgi:DNA-binding PadR family transcriptional regulator|nr:helix-turn-helix transcriptional regulator [Kouleothrix sp.]
MDKQRLKVYVPATTPIELNILISLLAEPRHGLGIIQEIAERTENEMFLSPGTLYSALKRMDKSGWIQQVEGGIEPADGNAERRTYHALTRAGQRMIINELDRMERFVIETRDLITKVRDDDQGGMPERQEQNCSDGDDLPEKALELNRFWRSKKPLLGLSLK